MAFKNDIIAELFDLEIDRHDNCGWDVSGAVSVVDVKRTEAPERIPVDAMDLTTVVSTSLNLQSCLIYRRNPATHGAHSALVLLDSV